MPIHELLLTEFDEEIKKTRTMLERVPEDKKDFAPHPKSMPLNKLAPHVAQLAGFGLTILTTPELDFAKTTFPPVPFESAAQLVKTFDEGASKARAALKNTPDEALDTALEAKFRGQAHFQRIAFSGLPADVPQSSGAPPRATRCVSALE